MKLDKESEIDFSKGNKYLGVIFHTSGRDNKEIRSRVMQARKYIACQKRIVWNKDIRKREIEQL